MDNNNYIEIRQKTNELMRQAFMIWQSSDYSENLEQLVDDPVFQMLMTAMAYQFNDIDSNLELMKQEVINDFADMFIPYNVDRIQPTTVVVKNQPAEGVGSVLLDDSSVFIERSSDLQFIPLLKTRVIRTEVKKVVRLDGRRWKITVDFPDGVTDLTGFTFALKDLMFRDFFLTIDDKPIPLIKPWNQYDLPFTDAFSFIIRMYNRVPVFNVMNFCLELLAQQDLCFFTIGDTSSILNLNEDVKSLDFVVEVNGIDENFVLDKSKLHLNVNLLVNAKINTVTLTHDKPIARISGEKDQKFMKLLAPSQDQIVSSYNVYVRNVKADRFNMTGLIKLLDCLVMKFQTDYYAFQLIKQQDGDAIIRSISALLQKLRKMASSVQFDGMNGVYLFLKDENDRVFKMASSFDVRYLSTNGTLPENLLNDNLTFSVPTGIDYTQVQQIAKPLLGSDDKFDNADHKLLIAYCVTTSDRLVTPADIKLFCMYRLMAYLSLGQDVFREITVDRRQSKTSYVGYEISVHIVLANTTIVRKTVGDRLPRLECLMEKLIEVRSMNIYPTRVTIELK